MIEMLDALDGDADLEPSLGGETKFHLDASGEMQAEVDLEGDDVDREASLGSFDRMLNQENWSRSSGWRHLGEDRELDECDREDGGDTESNGDELDYSDDPSGMDGGLGDLHGLEEQCGTFDRGGDEPKSVYRPYDQEAAAATRLRRQGALSAAYRLRARLGGLTSGPVTVTGPNGHRYLAVTL